MESAVRIVSPKQAARAIGVSESSLKRWCDRGLIRFERTAGGHRKIHLGDILEFARRTQQTFVSPELIGLPPTLHHTKRDLEEARTALTAALVNGNEELSRSIVFDLYLGDFNLSKLFDLLIAPAFCEIGRLWECHQAEVYQERRACQLAMQILNELRGTQRIQMEAPLAIGGTMEGDLYSLPSAMVEIVLRDVGFRANALGSGIPIESLVAALKAQRPRLFWMSVSHIDDRLLFVSRFAELSKVCETQHCDLVVGGNALTRELREQMSYTAYCDNTQHLETLGKSMIRRIAPHLLTKANGNSAD